LGEHHVNAWHSTRPPTWDLRPDRIPIHANLPRRKFIIPVERRSRVERPVLSAKTSFLHNAASVVATLNPAFYRVYIEDFSSGILL
jgi:hypothetical protein